MRQAVLPHSLGLPLVLWGVASSWPSCAWMSLNAQQVLAGKEALTLCTRGTAIPPRGTGELSPLPTLWHQVPFAQICILPVLTTVTAPSRVRMCCFTGKMQRLRLRCTYNKWIGAGLQTKADVYEDLRDAFQGSLFWTRSCFLWWTTCQLGARVV